ncbi:MAG: hypothetical protein JKY94_01045 [Rhodobacteraceae bacterium]|nr:hypothetical protein [Paracoccaceae bacterium]
MTPLEAVARAICEGRCAEASDKPCYELEGCSVKDCQSQPTCMEMAGAAANALAGTISDEMVEAVRELLQREPEAEDRVPKGWGLPTELIIKSLKASLLAAAEGK